MYWLYTNGMSLELFSLALEQKVEYLLEEDRNIVQDAVFQEKEVTADQNVQTIDTKNNWNSIVKIANAVQKGGEVEVIDEIDEVLTLDANENSENISTNTITESADTIEDEEELTQMQKIYIERQLIQQKEKLLQEEKNFFLEEKLEEYRAYREQK